MATKIDQKIVGYKVVDKEEANLPEILQEAVETIVKEVEGIKKVASLKRPLKLQNEWRLKPPYAEHALYVRLNAIEVEGRKHPFEIFFNTKDVTQVEWINALTLTLSIAFRTAIETRTNLQPLIDNLKETFGTRGSYLSKVPSKPKFVNGLVAEIGYVIEEFNNECLAWNYSNSTHESKPTAEKQEAVGLKYYESPLHAVMSKEEADAKCAEVDANVVTNPCPTCGEQLIIMDGCPTCTSCGYSKCG